MSSEYDPFGFGEISKRHAKLDAEFHRLCLDPCAIVPSVGDRVVVASGFIGRGHPWVREEARVIEVGSTSVKVVFAEQIYKKNYWVHSSLIVEVLGPTERERTDEQS